jgi:hypothetical protein
VKKIICKITQRIHLHRSNCIKMGWWSPRYRYHESHTHLSVSTVDTVSDGNCRLMLILLVKLYSMDIARIRFDRTSIDIHQGYIFDRMALAFYWIFDLNDCFSVLWVSILILVDIVLKILEIMIKLLWVGDIWLDIF